MPEILMFEHVYVTHLVKEIWWRDPFGRAV